MEQIGRDQSSKIRNSAIEKIFNGKTSSFLSLALLGLILYFIDAFQLPDFDSYQVMYEGGNSGGSYQGFSNIAIIFQSLGLDYLQFRFLVLAIGLVFVLIVFELRRNYYPYARKNSRIFSGKSFELTLLVSIFIFEFYVIRLRAGMSIFFFLLFFCIWQFKRKYEQALPLWYALLISAFLLSALIHAETFITIALFVGPVVIWNRFIKPRGTLNEFLYFTICLGGWLALFWFGITPSFKARGPDLFSPLNPIRFSAIAILPIVIWSLVRIYHFATRRDVLDKLSFSHLYTLNYVSSAIALTLYCYFSDEAEDAGEAIVRVMTLSSFGAILSLALGGLSYKNIIALYILIINSLFFLNTIYGWFG